mmetsp:Transcript_58756/g.139907  ORF Transcript_58756/g.139907 Transcript_58756/m.139907 type:complete len:231 (-) Transcript_58756:63-755(-)
MLQLRRSLEAEPLEVPDLGEAQGVEEAQRLRDANGHFRRLKRFLLLYLIRVPAISLVAGQLLQIKLLALHGNVSGDLSLDLLRLRPQRSRLGGRRLAAGGEEGETAVGQLGVQLAGGRGGRPQALKAAPAFTGFRKHATLLCFSLCLHLTHSLVESRPIQFRLVAPLIPEAAGHPPRPARFPHRERRSHAGGGHGEDGPGAVLKASTVSLQLTPSRRCRQCRWRHLQKCQ